MNEYMQTNENEFSWSLSRESLFNFCHRAYFYHYYASAGGFEQFSDSEKLYELKKIQPLDLWINSICAEVLRDFFYENLNNFNIHKASKRYFHKGARSISLREWRDDPQMLNLFESYYGLIEINELIEGAAKLLDDYINNLIESGLIDYLKEIPYLNRKNISFPISTNIGKIKVWSSPALVWQEDGLLKFLTLNNGASNKVKAHHTAALHKIFAFNNLRVKPERVVTLNFDLSCGESGALSDGEINVSELIDHVKNSSTEMLELSTDYNKILEDNFQKKQNNCNKCKFQKHCKYEIHA
jgi:hypothetical protein